MNQELSRRLNRALKASGLDDAEIMKYGMLVLSAESVADLPLELQEVLASAEGASDPTPPGDVTVPSPDTLVAALSSADPPARRKAARLLGKSRCIEAREALERVLIRDEAAAVRRAAACALGRLGQRRSEACLRKALSDPAESVNKAARTAIRRLGGVVEDTVTAQAAAHGLLLDLDDTIIMTSMLQELRAQRRWSEVHARLRETRLSPGFKELLSESGKDFAIAVVTSSPRSYAEKLLAHHRLDLPVVVAYHDTTRHKPDPAPLLQACEKLGLSPSRCVHVGDQAEDSLAAASAGICAISLTHDGSLYTDTTGAKAGWVCSDWREVAEVARMYLDDMARRNGRTTLVRLEVPKGRWVELFRGVADLYDADRMTANIRCDLGLTELRLGQRLESDIGLLNYHPMRWGLRDDTTQAVLDFKNGKSRTVRLVSELAVSLVKANEHLFRDKFACRLVVAAPTSKRGTARHGIEAVGAALAERFPWLSHGRGALIREGEVPTSHKSVSSERPTAERHAATIRWAGESRTRPEGRYSVLLLDDVLTTGHTAAGCRRVIETALPLCGGVVGCFIGRTC